MGLVFLVLQSGVRRDAVGAHAQLEFFGVFLGLSIFFLAASKFVTIREPAYLPLSLGFLASILFDVAHAAADRRATLALGLTGGVADGNAFFYAGWLSGVALGLGLLGAVLRVRRQSESGRPAQLLWRGALAAVLATTVLLAVAARAPLPGLDGTTLGRAAPVAPMVILGSALVLLVRTREHVSAGMRFVGSGSLVLAILGQAFRLLSSAAYDAWFFGAHLIEIGAYGVILFGLYAEHANLFVVERRLRETLERAHRDAIQSKRELEAVIDNVNDGIAIADRNGRIVRINQAGKEILGRDPTGEAPEVYLRTHRVLKLDGTPMRAEEHPLAVALMTGRPAPPVEVVSHRPNGDPRTLRCSAVPLFETGGQPHGAVCSFHDVTEIRHAEQRFRELTQRAPDAVVVMDEGGHITFFNAAAERMFEYSAAEALGRDVTLLMPERYRQSHLESRRRRLKSGQAEALNRNVEAHGLRKSGREFPLEVSLSAVRTPTGVNFIGNIRDTTVQHRIRRQREGILSVAQALSSSHSTDEFLQRACKAIATSTEFDACTVFLLDPAGRRLVLRASEHVPEEIVHRIREYPMQPDFPALAVQTLVRDRTIVEPRLQDRLDLPVGNDLTRKYGFQVVLSTPVRSGERHVGVLQVIASQGRHAQEEDIQVLELMSNELGLGVSQKLLVQQLELSTQELRRANQELDSFIYTASHDLSEPLRSISNFSHFLLEDYGARVDAEGRSHLERVHAGAQRMKRLLDDLLRLSRLGRHQVRREKLDLGHLVREVQENLDASLRERNAEILVRGEMPVVYADRTGLTEILSNLISNGIKFNESSPPRVEIGAQTTNGGIELYVRDNGIGIPPEHHERIFGLFTRLHARKEYSGTGAGLAIVKKILDTQGGSIRVDSEPGKGSTFYVRLPSPNGGNGAS